MKKFHGWYGSIAVAVLCGTSQAQILIGQTAGFTGPAAVSVKEITQGANLYIDAVNAKGGVNGSKIELISLDDKLDIALAAENARLLIEQKNVVAMFLTRGTPHTEALIPLLDKYGVPLVGPSTGAMVLHQPVKKHVFNVRSTYQREAEKALAHLKITRRISAVQGVLKLPEFLGTNSRLNFRGQFLQLGQITSRFHRQIEPETA